MIDERELWACAAHVIAKHGGEADRFVASRITGLAAAGDEAGVATWRRIADRIDGLRDGSGFGQARH